MAVFWHNIQAWACMNVPQSLSWPVVYRRRPHRTIACHSSFVIVTAIIIILVIILIIIIIVIVISIITITITITIIIIIIIIIPSISQSINQSINQPINQSSDQNKRWRGSGLGNRCSMADRPFLSPGMQRARTSSVSSPRA